MEWPSLGDTVKAGPRKTIVFLKIPSGEQPAKAYLDKVEVRWKTKMGALFAMMADQGQIRNKQKFKKVEESDNIWEFKSFQTRVLCFMGSDQRVVLVNGETKKGDRLTPALVRQAEQFRRAYYAGLQATKRTRA